MRLEKMQSFLNEKQWPFSYTEEDGVGSIDFEYRGVGYHVWEFLDGEYGAESNVRSGGKQEDFTGDYEQKILDVIYSWEYRKEGTSAWDVSSFLYG